MAISSKSIFDLPPTVILEISSLLNSTDVLCFASSCTFFNSIISKDYTFQITLPLQISDELLLMLKRKKILKMCLFIEGGGHYDKIDWKFIESNVLDLDQIVKHLKILNTENTIELSLKFDCNKISVPAQKRQNYQDLRDIISKMTQLIKCEIEIISSFIDSRMAWIHHIHIFDILLLCHAKEVILTFPEMSLEKHSISLALSNAAEKITIIGPCKGLISDTDKLTCFNAAELIVQPLSQTCTLYNDSFHNNGMCVVNVKSTLKNNPRLQYYNGIFVGDLYNMRECCQHSVLLERFFNDYVKKGGSLTKNKWSSIWSH